MIGGENDEIVSLRAGNNIINLGGGDDLVIFYESDHTDFKFNYENNSIVVTNIKTGSESKLTGVEKINSAKPV